MSKKRTPESAETSTPKVETFSIKSAAIYLGIDAQYMRKLIRDGKIHTTLVAVNGTRVQRHEISLADLEAYKQRAHVRSGGRADGRNKVVVYANPSELNALVTFCDEHKMPAPVMPNLGEYKRRKAKRALQPIDADADSD